MSLPTASLTSSSGPAVASPPLFSCTRRAEGRGSIRLVLAGELDLSARAHFEEALKDAQSDANRVVLDLQALTLIDCASLSVLFDAALEARRQDAVLILLEPRGQVRRVLDLTGAPNGVAVLERSDGERRAAGAF
ncbi:MAG TPA: STAS domain-containing protein [Solirubrobacterales bacterium]